MNLATAYRLVGLLVLGVAVFELLVLEDLQMPAFVVGGCLAMVSFLAPAFPKQLAIVALGLAVLVPLEAFFNWQAGLVAGFIPIVDLVVFGGLGFVALRSLRAPVGES